MKFLLTGGAGFIGSRLTQRLLDQGHHVVVVDNLSTGQRHCVPKGAQFIEGDVGQPETVARFPDGVFDGVCHLAAQSSGAVSMERPVYDFQTNALSTLLLTRWCIARGIRRLLYASSMAVYGNPDTSPVREDSAVAPISYYGVSKLASEHLLRLAETQGLRTTSFRMFNVYGPGQNMQNLRQGMASIYLAYLLNGREVPVTGSLDRFRDFVYIDDVIDAWMKALSMPSTPSTVYNISSGKPTTVRELLRFLIEACSLPPDHPIREQAAPPGDQFGLFGDSQRAGSELGWRPQVPLDEGLRRFVAWAKDPASHG